MGASGSRGEGGGAEVRASGAEPDVHRAIPGGQGVPVPLEALARASGLDQWGTITRWRFPGDEIVSELHPTIGRQPAPSPAILVDRLYILIRTHLWAQILVAMVLGIRHGPDAFSNRTRAAR